MASGRAESSYFEPRQEVASKVGMVRGCQILNNQSDKLKIQVFEHMEDGKVAQWLRALTALLKVLSSNPCNHMMAHNHLC